MQLYTETQTRKLISAYGGVGSIIETIHGALMVKPFDRWLFFNEVKKGTVSFKEIEDARLLRRLQHNFKNLKRFIAVPPNAPDFYIPTKPEDDKAIAAAEYFPKWMYCPKCSRFKILDDWWRGWKRHYSGNIKQQQESFTPPKCCHCYQDAVTNKKGKKYYELEQVRFVMTAPNGEIKDVPWERWTIALKNQSPNDNDPTKVDLQWGLRVCCENQDLRYLTSNQFSDFSGIRIKCVSKDCSSGGREVNLSGLFSLRTGAGKAKDEHGRESNLFFKPVLRTSNSVYYPIIWNSIFLPKKDKLSAEEKKDVSRDYSKGKSIEQIAAYHNLSVQDIKEFLTPNEVGFISEEDYRLREYQFLLENENFYDDNLAYFNISLGSLKEKGFAKLLQIRRLKMTSVQTGYTRQEPLSRDEFAQNSDGLHDKNGVLIKAKYTSSKNSETEELPAVESFGEGFFIDIDNEKLNEWYNFQYEQNEHFRSRLETLNNNNQLSGFERYGRSPHFENFRRLAKFLVLHTLSHLLIKELEFLAGYPATSMQERLYLNDGQMQGVLIYTIAGSEGSYGGLISQATPEKFEKLFHSALERAKDCASDPVCYDSDGQGIANLNLAACYSCALLPETSCEEFNSLLDRAMLVDKKFGFF
jgi:hypothetical protein